MIACLDVDYKNDTAQVACLLYKDWTDSEICKSYKLIISDIHEYIPGQFYKRELPCITQVLEQVEEELSLIVIDGYVWLKDEEHPGLGAYLYKHLNGKIPVIGVAKNKFKSDNGNSGKVYRGESAKPLFVTTAGISVVDAVDKIGKMHGDYRIPTLLKMADQYCRDWPAPE